MVGVAQLVEPLTVTQVVEGSSPFTHPIFDLKNDAKRRCFERLNRATIYYFQVKLLFPHTTELKSGYSNTAF